MAFWAGFLFDGGWFWYLGRKSVPLIFEIFGFGLAFWFGVTFSIVCLNM